MSFDVNDDIFYYELIYKQDDNEQKIIYTIKDENNAFKMIYKPNKNKDEKTENLKMFKNIIIFTLKMIKIIQEM